MKPGEQRDRTDHDDPGADRADQATRPMPVAGEESEREDTEIAGEPGKVGGRALDALGPGQAQGGPEDEGGKEPQAAPGKAAERLSWQGSDRHGGQQYPPDGDADLVMDERVIAAALEAEIDDQAEGEQPDCDCRPVDPRLGVLSRRRAGERRGGLHRP